MKTKHWFALLALGALLAASQRAPAQGTAFSYQGRLTDQGAPAEGLFDLRFALYDSLAAGNQLGAPLDREDTPVTNGLFTVTLDFGAEAFTGPARWLEIAVRPGDSAEAHTVLEPRQQLYPVPYAIFADAAASAATASTATTANSVAWLGLSGLPAGFADGIDNDTIYSAGAGLVLAGSTFSLDTTLTDQRYWRLGGNAGTTPQTSFVGTTDDQPLEFKVNNARALRLEPNYNGAANLIGGANVNSILAGTLGAVIAGGGTPNDGQGAGTARPNVITHNYGAILGGMDQRVDNIAGIIGGGRGNWVQGGYGAIVGGRSNRVEADFGMVLGGERCPAGYFAFAGGRRATAAVPGAFVWADSTEADFAALFPNEFAVRARGGVRFVTAGAGLTMDGRLVLGSSTANGQLTLWNDAYNTEAIQLSGSNHQISLQGRNGAEQLRLIGEIGGHLLLFDRNNTDQTVTLSSGSTFFPLPAPGRYVDAGGSLTLAHSNNALRASLLAPAEGGKLLLLDSAGVETVELLGAESDIAGGQLTLKNAAGASTVKLQGNDTAAGWLGLYRGDGTLMCELDALDSTSASQFSMFDSNGIETVEIKAAEGPSTGGAQIALRKRDGTTTITLDADLGGKGRIVTQELEITGGSDLSEQFDVVAADGAEAMPGMVVCIDPTNPGRLAISRRAYDRTVIRN